MYYRVEVETYPDKSGIGYDFVEGWQGIFRPGGFYWDLLEKGARDYEACNRLRKYWYENLEWVQLPPGENGYPYQFWFTELGYKRFEEVVDLFLLALSHMPEAKDIRVFTSDLTGEKIVYEDEQQVAVLI